MGQYQVLFWDGSVMRVGEDVMTDDTIGPDEAWKVSRADASGG
jgi:prepilin-type processing-associated H-X9-DG protein